MKISLPTAKNCSRKSDNPQKLTDKNLYSLCKMYGMQALEARRKFAGLLPEVFKRGLFEKRNFHSIYEFAARLCGMSREQVDVVLRMERKFQNMPLLYGLLVRGEVSHNKLLRVASIATPENEAELERAVRILSKAALDVFVRDVKYAQDSSESDSGEEKSSEQMLNYEDAPPTAGQAVNLSEERKITKNQFQDGLFKPKTEQNSLPGQSGPRTDWDERDSTVTTLSDTAAPSDAKPSNTAPTSSVDLTLLAALSPQLKTKLHELLNKGLDLNQILLQLLDERDEKIEQTKQQIALNQNEKEEIEKNIGKRASRHIPASIRKIIHAEYGTMCSISGCIKPAANLHHTQRFSVSQSHNPYFIAPLCKGHHDIAHKMDEKYATQICAV